MKQTSSSYAFLAEMIWVCGFFAICAGIFVMVFMKAETLSRQADTLNRAVQAVSNVMETQLSETDPERFPIRFSDDSSEDFTILIEGCTDAGLLNLTVTAVDPDDHSVIYSLTGARALPEGGRS